MDDEARREMIADTLRPVMEDGEGYQVLCDGEDVWVTPIDSSPGAIKYPQLYGRMLSLNAVMERVLGSLPMYARIVTVGFCVGLHLGWWDQWLGAELVKKLNSAWFYVFLVFVVWGALHHAGNVVRWRIWCQRREEVLSLMEQNNVDRDSLVSLLLGDANVWNVLTFLKIDPVAESRFENVPQGTESR